MKFLWPHLLWLLAIVPVLIAAYLYVLRRKKKAVVRYASLSMIRDALGPGPTLRRHVPPALFLLALIAMVGAVARPAAVVTLPSQHEIVVLAIDVSGSMRATDVEPNRLAAAQTAAKTFVNEQPRSTRIGVVAFAATCAAASRFGSTSVARMLPETSIASTTVSCCEGSVTTAAGRAIATIIAIRASRNRMGGMCRRSVCAGPSASRIIVRLA